MSSEGGVTPAFALPPARHPSSPCVLCFSSRDGRHPIKRWSGNDIWLNAPRLMLPGCTLTIMGNVRGLQSQPAAQAGLEARGFFFFQFVFMVKKMYFLVQCFGFFLHLKRKKRELLF